VACLLASGGVAYAWLTASATGASSASTSPFAPVTVAPLAVGDTTTADLQPGGSGDVVLRVSNPNPFPVTLIAVAANGAVTASGGTGVCTTSGVSFINQSGLTDPIAASGISIVHLTSAATMSAASQSGCQGATFAIPVSITVHSS
jgi:hypothetical protein